MLEQIFSVSFITAFLAAAVRMAAPLMYASLGECFAEKSGVLNMGMEGVMLSGAFFSFVGAFFSKSIAVGLLCGILGGLAISMIHALLAVVLGKDHSVAGIALNMFTLGVTSYLFKVVSSGQGYMQFKPLSTIKIPFLSEIPFIGDAFFNQDIFVYALYVLVILATIFYKKTNVGLSFAAVGERPRAAEAAGIAVHRTQLMSMIINGILGGIGGAYLVLVQLGTFTEDMTAGRGYIALAAVILGRYTPLGTFGAALLFGATNALQIRFQVIGVPIPANIMSMLPYVITLIALLGAVGKNSQPENLAKPYIRGTR